MIESPDMTHAREWAEDRNTLDGKLHLAEVREFFQLGWTFCLIPRRDPARMQTLYIAALTPEEGCWLTTRMLQELGPLRLDAGLMLIELRSLWHDIPEMADEAMPGLLIRPVSYNGVEVQEKEWTRLGAADIPAAGMCFTPEPDVNLPSKGWPR